MHRFLPPLVLTLAIQASCADESSDSAGGTPDFNYIPVNDDVCVPTTQAQVDSAHGAIDGLISADVDADGAVDYAAYVVQDFALAGSGGACDTTDNPLGSLLDDLDAGGWVEDSSLLAGYSSARSYFNAALSYPIRDLVIHVDPIDGGLAAMAMTQGVYTECVGDCDSWGIQVESLGADCSTLGYTLVGTWTDDGKGGVAVASSAAAAPFGFYVPLMASLPDPALYPTVHQLLAAVSSNPMWQVVVEEPSVNLALSGDGLAHPGRANEGTETTTYEEGEDPGPDAAFPSSTLVDDGVTADDEGVDGGCFQMTAYLPIANRARCSKAVMTHAWRGWCDW